MANKIIHKHSSVITDGKAKLPEAKQLEYGELAVNYAEGVETISLKNSANEIVEFKSSAGIENIIEENELVIASALTNLDERLKIIEDNDNNNDNGNGNDNNHNHGTIILTGDVTGNGVINSNNDITITATVTDNSHDHTSSNISDSISASSGITSSATGLVQGKAVEAYAATKGHTHAGVYAPVAHASSANTYGVGTTANYGHVKISNGDVNTTAHADGLVAGMDHSHGNYSLSGHTHSAYATTGTVTALETRVGTAETNITNLQNADTALETAYKAADTALKTELNDTISTTANGLQDQINGKLTSSHTGTTATTGATGHVKLVTGNLNGQAYANGVAAAAAHTHSQYSGTGHTHSQYATTTNLNAVAGRVTTIEGSDAGSSMRTVAADEAAKEVAKVLDNAPEAFDTLKEIANWIGTGNTNTTATQMITDIAELEGTVSGFTSSNTVKATTDALQTAVNGKAPKSHASTTNTYGLGTTANYGHVKISNGDVNTVASADGLVAGMDHSHGNYSLTGHTHSAYSASGHTHGTITLTGDVTGSASIGSGTTAINITTTVADDSHNHTKLGTATKGSATQPIYLSSGTPTKCTSIDNDLISKSGGTSTLEWNKEVTLATIAGQAIKAKLPVNPDTNSDTKVTQTVTITNASYPLLLGPSGQTATTTTTSYFDSGVTLNPSTNTISANISGNAATATKLGTENKGSATQPIYLSSGTPTACNYTLGKSVPSDAKFTDTDTKVTSVNNHYTPTANTGSTLTASASGGTAEWDLDVVTGLSLQRDAKGHVTGVSVISGKIPNVTTASTTSYGMVQLKSGELSGVTSHVDSIAASYFHTHGQYAPKSHASSAKTYGEATTANYGHVKISNGDVNTTAHADGLVAGMDHSHGNYSLTGHTHSQYALQSDMLSNEKVIASALNDLDTRLLNINRNAITNASEIKVNATELVQGRAVYDYAAIKEHATSAKTYGVATTTVYGHVKISNGDVSTIASTEGKAAGMDHYHSKTRISTTATNAYMPMLFVNATASGDTTIYIDSSTGTGQTSSGIRYNPSGNTCYCSGGFFEASDERLKNFGDNIEVDLEKLAQLPKKYFTWKDDKDGKVHIGTSAQELQKIYPELVDTLEDGTLIVSYDTLSVIALKGVDTLYEKYKSLEERLNKLEKMLE